MAPTSPRFRWASYGLCALVIAVGFLVLLGWWLDISILKSILPVTATMKPNTAVLLILLSTAQILLLRSPGTPIVPVLAAFAAVVGTATIIEYLTGQSWGIDRLLFPQSLETGHWPGRIGFNTAVVFVLLGCRLMVVEKAPGVSWKDLLTLVAMVIALFATLGYLFGVSALYRFQEFNSMALNTSLSFFLLSLAIVAAEPERGILRAILAKNMAGDVLRRFFPLTILLAILLGWACLWGEKLGLYDQAFGLSGMVVALILLPAAIVWRLSRSIGIHEQQRDVLADTLRSSELRFQEMLGTLTEGFQIIDFQWRYLYLNDSAIVQSHLPRERLLGRTMMECYPGIDETPLFELLQKTMTERTLQRYTNAFVYPNGETGWFELTIQPAPDGIAILSTDVTADRRARFDLEDRERKLTQILEILPLGVSILNSQREVTYSNPALLKMFNISDAVLRALVRNPRQYLKSDGSPMLDHELASSRALAEGVAVHELETGVVLTGGVRWYSVSAVPVDFADWKVVVVTTDITARKQAEQQILDLNAALETRVNERTAELVAAIEQKNLFVANTSHELRTPLNAIIGLSEVLVDGKVGPLLAEQQDFLQDVLSSSRHLLGLINEMLDLAKIEAGKVEFNPVPIAPGVPIQDAVAAMKPLLSAKNLTLVQEVDPSLETVWLDVSRFRQLLYNYLSNAIKFTPEKGAITIRLFPVGSKDFRLEVEDNGVGISEEDQKKLFVAFSQVGTPSQQNPRGTGLGLSLTRSLVEAQGGRVGVKSTVGQGSVFFAQFPVRWTGFVTKSALPSTPG